jgi:hypothetical protein
MAPLPPPCIDGPSMAAAARASELGIEPPAGSCEEAAALGLCRDSIMRSRCPVACLSCARSSFNASLLGVEPPPVAEPYIHSHNLNDTNRGVSGSLDPIMSGVLAQNASERARSRETSAAFAAAHATLSPLITCDAPQPAFVGSSSAFRDLNSASGGSGLQCAFGDPPQLLLTPASFLQPSNDDLGSTALRNESSALQAAPIASTVAPSALLFCTTPASMRSVASETVPLRVVMNGEEGAAQLGVAAATDVRFAYYAL